MAVAGRVLMIPAGTWTSGTNYGMLDVVIHAGSSYVAKKQINNSTVAPPSAPSDWQLLAQGHDVTNLVTKSMIVNNFLATDPNTVLSGPMGKSLKDQLDQQNSNLTAFKDTTTSLLKNEPCALDNNATNITFYKSYGTVSVQMSFTIAWNIAKDTTELICVIPIGFAPQLSRWLLTRTYNTDKPCSFTIRKNVNDVWCLFLTATAALSAGDVINTSFVYQLY